MIIKFEKFRFGSNYGRTRSEYQMTCLEFVFHLLVLVWHSFTFLFLVTEAVPTVDAQLEIGLRNLEENKNHKI